MNWKGLISGVVFLTVVNAIRTGKAPIFKTDKAREDFVKTIVDERKAAMEGGK